MNKDEFQIIQTTQPLENLRIAKKLLLMQLDYSLKIDKVEKVLGVGDLCEAFPLDLMGIVADLLGVPEDDAEIDEETGEYPDDSYCRDWVWYHWSPTYHPEATDDPDEYVMSYIMYITKELSKGENNEC